MSAHINGQYQPGFDNSSGQKDVASLQQDILNFSKQHGLPGVAANQLPKDVSLLQQIFREMADMVAEMKVQSGNGLVEHTAVSSAMESTFDQNRRYHEQRVRDILDGPRFEADGDSERFELMGDDEGDAPFIQSAISTNQSATTANRQNPITYAFRQKVNIFFQNRRKNTD